MYAKIINILHYSKTIYVFLCYYSSFACKLHTPWVITDANLPPCKGKSVKNSRQNIRLLPLQGVLLIAIIPRAMPRARSFWAFSPYLNHMRKFSGIIYYYYLISKSIARSGDKLSVLCALARFWLLVGQKVKF